MAAGDGTGVRLAEMVAALSLATDLGLGQPQEHVLRQTVIARRLAAAAGLSEADQRAVFYASLLAWVGCVADSSEMARWFGDDIQLRADSYEVDKLPMPMMRFMVGHVGVGASPLGRITMIGRFLTAGMREAATSLVTHCQTTAVLSDQLGLDAEVGVALRQAFERWDGKGIPDRLHGASIAPAMRVVHLADDVEVFERVSGPTAALDMARSRRGTEFDPDLVDVLCDRHDAVFEGLDELDAWDVVVGAAGPSLGPELVGAELTAALAAFADYADLKSACWLGHSRHVGELAASAARRLGLPARDVTLAERAGLVHDIGAIGVSSGVWDKPGALSNADHERVRTHPYLTERVLARPAALAEIGAVAALHHEAVDGSGYPRGLRGDAIPMTARVVAAADVYDALSHDRPQRQRLDPHECAEVLRSEVTGGRLDGEAVNAVLAAAGHRVRRRAALPAGLTPREVEVLVLVARGWSNKAIARELSVSARTVGSHIEHAYTKAGVSTRGAAAMFAMRHGLVPASEDDEKIG
jgi:HD-GYP domain-containing protein (c-di-GMP phosphodiesterase class II)